MNQGFKITVVAAAASFLTNAACADPINCAKDKRPDEVAVCTIPGMVEVDRNVDGFYRTLMGRLQGPARTALVKTQREFLAERRKCGGETDCIRLTYRARSQELQAAIRELEKRP
jgi:uncharacterized protein